MGITGNHTDFISETRIRALAEEHNLAVIMPSGYNAFYLDQPESHNYYGSFVGEELVRMARSMFPLSTRREDTFIGGVSMGRIWRPAQRPALLRELWCHRGALLSHGGRRL